MCIVSFCCQFLDKTVMKTGLLPEEYGNRFFRVAHAEMVGRRPTMEDAVSIQLFFRNREDEAYFGLFDGHGGRKASEFAGLYLHDLVAQV